MNWLQVLIISLTSSDWHTALRRQYIITLSGEAEIGLGDGTIHVEG